MPWKWIVVAAASAAFAACQSLEDAHAPENGDRDGGMQVNEPAQPPGNATPPAVAQTPHTAPAPAAERATVRFYEIADT